MKKLSLAILYLLLVPACGLWAGFVTSVLWAWFIVPIGVREIGVAQGTGLDLLIAFLLSQLPSRSEVLEAVGKEVPIQHHVARAIFTPGLFLFLGWLFHLGMTV